MSQPRTFRRVLVLGGARSGKSTVAEQLASDLGEPVLYVATAVVLDDEMAARVRQHQVDRPSTWQMIEEPRRVADRVTPVAAEVHTVLLEDLTILLSNLMLGEQHSSPHHDLPALDADDLALAAHAAEQELTDQLECLVRLPCHLVMVSNEVGMGLVPPFPLGRVFRDALGRVNQHAAARSDEVYLVVAGIATRLKPAAWRLPRVDNTSQD